MRNIQEILLHGDLKILGRLVDASNATLLAQSTLQGEELKCIYKPIAGERPLWDFDEGTLAYREYATYLLSEKLNLHLVPTTVLREGPYGLGMIAEWIEIDDSIDLMDFFQSQDEQLRKMALFDAIINNTDRKIGHLLPTKSGKLFGCDHGVTFHRENKLRTVLWQWAGQPLSGEELARLELASNVFTHQDAEFGDFLSAVEIDATRVRIEQLLDNRVFPSPNPDWPSVPWPPF